MNVYLTVREIQVWLVLVPSVLFVIGYAATEFRRKDPASWYIMGWGITCVSAFALSAIRLWSDAEWTKIAGVVLGFMVLGMVWWMLGALIWVWYHQHKYRKQEANGHTTEDSK